MQFHLHIIVRAFEKKGENSNLFVKLWLIFES